jgi:hypothetical protein
MRDEVLQILIGGGIAQPPGIGCIDFRSLSFRSP